MRAFALPAVTAAVLSTVFVLACASAPRGSSTAASTSGDAAGQAIYRSHCGSCHRLHDPSERTGADWTAQVERMASRAHLSGADRTAVVEYLKVHAKDAEVATPPR